MERKLRIAILGTRGIPAAYGGFETFAEELSAELSMRGHEVTVFSRYYWGKRPPELQEWRGARLIHIPAIPQKYLETPLHALFSLIKLKRGTFDVILVCNAANSPFIWIGRLKGLPVAVNVDGIERLRGKWNVLGRLWYRLGEVCSVLFSSAIVADADLIAEYYKKTYRASSSVIRYGATAETEKAGDTLDQFGLQPGRYVLYVSRLEPENNAKGVIQAYAKVKGDLPLVIVGDAPYAAAYKEELRRLAGSRVIFTGFQFGKAYRELRTYCQLYVQATEVGGTHPALVEAMAYGNCIVANKVPEHEEVLGEAGLYYEKNDFDALAEQIQKLLADEQLRRDLSSRAKERAKALFSWRKVADDYEKLFSSLI